MRRLSQNVLVLPIVFHLQKWDSRSTTNLRKNCDNCDKYDKCDGERIYINIGYTSALNLNCVFHRGGKRNPTYSNSCFNYSNANLQR